MVSWEDYNKRSTDLHMQFDLAKKALNGFRDTPEALEKYATSELEDIQNDMQEHFEKTGKDPRKSWMHKESETKKYIKNTIKSVPSRLEEIENRLNQNHLIILVTLFESFMKDIHKRILCKNLSLLNPDRKIPLGRINNIGLETIIEEEISREINSLDRKSIEGRCKYFKEKLSIDWSFDGTALPLIKSTLETRNKILHEEPDYKLSRFELNSAIAICMGITLVTVVQAHLLYPKYFEKLHNSKELEDHLKKKLNI